jgi:hypothetical protein
MVVKVEASSSSVVEVSTKARGEEGLEGVSVVGGSMTATRRFPESRGVRALLGRKSSQGKFRCRRRPVR